MAPTGGPYPRATEATWKPAESFAGCRELLTAFERGLEPVAVAEVGEEAAGREIIGIAGRGAIARIGPWRRPSCPSPVEVFALPQRHPVTPPSAVFIIGYAHGNDLGLSTRVIENKRTINCAHSCNASMR